MIQLRKIHIGLQLSIVGMRDSNGGKMHFFPLKLLMRSILITTIALHLTQR